MSRTIILCALILANLLSPVWAQQTPSQLELSTPHDAMWVHLYYLQHDTYDAGLSATAFTNADSTTREVWAIQLKQVLDGAGLYVHMNLLPQEEDYRDTVANKHFYTPFPAEMPEIFLVKTGDKWHYSDETTSAIPKLHRRVYPLGTHVLVNMFSQRSDKTFLGLSGWQYAGIGLLLLLSALLYWLLRALLRMVISRSTRVALSTLEDFPTHVKKIASVTSVALMVWLIKLLVPLLQLPVRASAFIQLTLRVTLTILVMLTVLRIVNLVADYLAGASARTDSRMDDQIVPLLKQILKIIVIGLAVIQVLRLLDFNVTALIAGVSIGGLALALAAQDTVKNFLGSVMIFTDRPFQIGDWVEGSGFAGSVVEVGFRSTRIKTSDTSVISVPNGNMANVSVTNKGVREYRLFASTLGLTYDTPPDLIEHFLTGIKKVIVRHPEVSNEDYYVFFTEMGASSLNVLVRAYMIAPTYTDELRIKESLHLAIMRWAEALGVQFAFPTTTLHIEDMPGQASLAPSYHTDEAFVEDRWNTFLERFEKDVSR